MWPVDAGELSQVKTVVRIKTRLHSRLIVRLVERYNPPETTPISDANLCLRLCLQVMFDASQKSHLAVKHRLNIQRDFRQRIDLTLFGFLRHGYLAVNLTNFQLTNKEAYLTTNSFGFSLDKTMSVGISPALQNGDKHCALQKSKRKGDNNIPRVLFLMDFKQKRLVVERKEDDFKHLNISVLSVVKYEAAVQYPEAYQSPTRTRRSSKGILYISDKIQLSSTLAGVTETTIAGVTKTTLVGVTNPTKVPPKKVLVPSNLKDTAVKTTLPSVNAMASSPPVGHGGDKHAQVPTSKPANLKLVTDSIPMIEDSTGRFSVYFLVRIEQEVEEGLYNLFFYNCYNYNQSISRTFVHFSAYLIEKNKDSYLSAGDIPLPPIYFILCMVYTLLGSFWFYVLRSSKDDTFKIHYLMLVLVFVKALALFFHAVNLHFIQKEGHHEQAFAILYYITYLMRGILLFVTIVLIGAGWAFIKYILSDRDKKIFVFIIPLQILANVAQIFLEETEEGQSVHTMWKRTFYVVDLLCCGGILFPVVWSIRHLQEASTTDGKAAISLAKLKMFQHFYIMIVCYIYFTRIIDNLLTMAVPFQYTWLCVVFKEISTVIFFLVTGYKFQPASNNPYLQVATESDDEVEMDEVVTPNGVYDTLQKVNMHTKDGG
ncbi:G protein-coupled receptor [Lamellibrachia satsuma]|nr:G protein-coupled receptor [Lamellibrachia satsuma]